MAERKTRFCAVCQSEYKFCNRCKEDAMKPTWYFTFCSENCHDLYKVMADFENGHIPDVEAKEQLSKLDLSKRECFGTSYKNTLQKIMKAKSLKKSKRCTVEKELDICCNVKETESFKMSVDTLHNEVVEIIEDLQNTVSSDCENNVENTMLNGDLL